MSAADAHARVEWLTIVGDVETWRSIGLIVIDDGFIPLHGTSLRITPSTSSDPRLRQEIGDPVHEDLVTNVDFGALTGWALSGVPDLGSVGATMSIDGLHTDLVEAVGPLFADHPLGASSLDHVVVLTPDLERTSAAIAEATGSDLRRIREFGSTRQGFHRMGERGAGGLIVELVERPDIPAGDATFWGVVLIVDDLDAACDSIGADRVSSPKDAVQPGRRIATLRTDIGLGLPVALMTA